MDYTIENDKSLKLQVFKVSYYLTIISNLIIYIAQPFDINLLEMLSSRCFLLCNMVSFIFAINHSLKKYVPYKTKQIVTIIFMICFSYISYLGSSGSGLYGYVIRLLCYLALPFYFLYIDYVKPDKTLLNVTYVINFLISIVFAYLSFTEYRYAGYEMYIGTDGAWLTLGYANPNQTAMYLLITIIILLCAFYYYKKKSIRFVILMDIVYMGWLLYETSSRTCIIIGLFILFTVIFKRQYKIPKFLMVGILLLPLIFMIFYPILYENGLINLIEIAGKADYSSRSYIFRNVISSVQDQILFGDFGNYQLQNLHNGTLSIYSSLGLVGLILFYVYYIRAYFYILSNGIKSRTAYISMIGLMAVFLHACTEGAFFIGGSMFAGSLCVLILLVKQDGKETD